MKQPNPAAERRAAKNKKQMIMLLALVGLLGIVLIVQCGGMIVELIVLLIDLLFLPSPEHGKDEG